MSSYINFRKVLHDREDTVIHEVIQTSLQHKLAEVSKDRDELKYNYCLIVGPQQKIFRVYKKKGDL